MSLFYSNPLGGRAVIFTILFESIDSVTELFMFGGFCRQHFVHFPPPTLAHFLDVRIFLEHDLTFSLTFKCVQCQACRFAF